VTSPFSIAEVIEARIVVDVVFEYITRKHVIPLDYEPLHRNPFDHIRAIAERAGLTMDDVRRLAHG
jgi:hypothetical protein